MTSSAQRSSASSRYYASYVVNPQSMDADRQRNQRSARRRRTPRRAQQPWSPGRVPVLSHHLLGRLRVDAQVATTSDVSQAGDGGSLGFGGHRPSLRRRLLPKPLMKVGGKVPDMQLRHETIFVP